MFTRQFNYIILIVILLFSNTFISSGRAIVNIDHIESFDKGPSYQPVVPIKKITFVNYDEETYLDDYSYLSAIPTSVFNASEKLFSHPLLFYQDEIENPHTFYSNDHHML